MAATSSMSPRGMGPSSSSPSPTRVNRSASLCTTVSPVGHHHTSNQKSWSPKPGGYVGNFVAPSHVAAQASYPSLFYSMYVYNPLLAKGNEEKALDNILYYFPQEDDDNTKMNRVGFSTACTCISERFSVLRDDGRDREDLVAATTPEGVGEEGEEDSTSPSYCCHGMGLDGQRDLADEIRTRHRLITLYSPVQDLWFAIESHPHVDSNNVKQLLRKAVSSFITLCGPRALLLESPPSKRYVPGADPNYDQRLRYSEYNRSAINSYFSDFAHFLVNFGLPSPVAGVVVAGGQQEWKGSFNQREGSVSGGDDVSTPSTPITVQQQQQDPYLTYRQQTASDALLSFPPRIADSVDSLAATALEVLLSRYMQVLESPCGDLWAERCGEYEATMPDTTTTATTKPTTSGRELASSTSGESKGVEEEEEEETSFFWKQASTKPTLDKMYQNLADVGVLAFFTPQVSRGVKGVQSQQQNIILGPSIEGSDVNSNADSPRHSTASPSRSSPLPLSSSPILSRNSSVLLDGGVNHNNTTTTTGPFIRMLSTSPLHSTMGSSAAHPFEYEDKLTTPTTTTTNTTQPVATSLSVLLCHVDEGRVLYSSLPDNLTSRLMMITRSQLPLLDELSVEKVVDTIDTQATQVVSRLSSQVRDGGGGSRTVGGLDESISSVAPTVRVGADAISRCSAKAFDLNNLTLDSLREASLTASQESSKRPISTPDEIRLNRRLRSLSSKCGVFDVFVERENTDGTLAGESNVFVRRAIFVRVNGFGVFILSPPMAINAGPVDAVDISRGLGQHWYYTSILATALLYRRSLIREMVSCCGGVAAHGLLRACELRSSTLRAKIARGSGGATSEASTNSKLRGRGTTVTGGAGGSSTHRRAHASTVVASKAPSLSSTITTPPPHQEGGGPARKNALTAMFDATDDGSTAAAASQAHTDPSGRGGGGPSSSLLPNVLRCQLIQQLSISSQLQTYHQLTMGSIVDALGPSPSSVLESLSLEVSARYLVLQSEYVSWVAATGVEESLIQFADPRLPLDTPLRTLKLLLRSMDPHDPWVAHITQRHPSVLIHHARTMFPTQARVSAPLVPSLDNSHPHSPQYAVYPSSFNSFSNLSRGHVQLDADITQVPCYSGVLSPLSATHPTVLSFSGVLASRTPLWVLPRDIQWEVAKYIAETLKPSRTHTTANRPHQFSSQVLGQMSSFNVGAGDVARLLKGLPTDQPTATPPNPLDDIHMQHALEYNTLIASLKALEAQTGMCGTSVAPRGEYSSSDLAVEPSSCISELWVSLCPVRRGGIRIHRHNLGRGGGGTHLGDETRQDDGHATATLAAARGELLGLATSGSGQVLAIYFPSVRPGTPAIYSTLPQCMDLGSMLFNRSFGSIHHTD